MTGVVYFFFLWAAETKSNIRCIINNT